MVDLQPSHRSLGVGSIISEGFSLFFRRLTPIFLTGLLVSFPINLALIYVLGIEYLSGQGGPFVDEAGEALAMPSATEFMMLAFFLIVSGLGQGLWASMITMLVYDTKGRRSPRIGGYLRSALRIIPTVLAVSLIVGILSVFGMIFLILPGIWIMAVFSVAIPSLVIERAGFGAFDRSAELTKGYRWPIMGLLVVMFLISDFFSTQLNSIFSAVSPDVMGVEGKVPLSVGVYWAAVNATSYVLSYGFTAVMLTLLYFRLREITEGRTMEFTEDSVQ